MRRIADVLRHFALYGARDGIVPWAHLYSRLVVSIDKFTHFPARYLTVVGKLCGHFGVTGSSQLTKRYKGAFYDDRCLVFVVINLIYCATEGMSGISPSRLERALTSISRQAVDKRPQGIGHTDP